MTTDKLIWDVKRNDGPLFSGKLWQRNDREQLCAIALEGEGCRWRAVITAGNFDDGGVCRRDRVISLAAFDKVLKEREQQGGRSPLVSGSSG